MSQYPELVWRLERAAFMQGMSTRTEIIAVADGGNGLREALEKQFPRLTFILDRPHLKQYLYAGAEAIGLTGFERHNWVSDKLQLIDRGQVRRVISTLKRYRGGVVSSASLTCMSIWNVSLMPYIMKNFLPKVYPLVQGKWKAPIAIFHKSG